MTARTAATLDAAAEIGLWDVLEYDPQPRFEGQFDVRWCREGTAIVEGRTDGSLYAVDTYWGSCSDAHVLTDAELATAVVQFNLTDFDEIDKYARTSTRWLKFAPADRARITSQHGLQSRWFIRKGSVEDHATQVQNAVDDLARAEGQLRFAEQKVDWARQDLAAFRAAADSERGDGDE